MSHVKRSSSAQGSVAQLIEQWTSNPKVVDSDFILAMTFLKIQLVVSVSVIIIDTATQLESVNSSCEKN